MIRRFSLLLFAFSLAACTTFDDRELASFRARHVPPPVYSKLSRGEPLEPSDVIELTRRGVADSLIIRQIEDHGVASFITRSDVLALRKAGVRAAVIDAMLRASDDEFARGHAGPDDSIYAGGYDPYFGYYDPWPWYGGVGIGFSTSRYYRGHHHHHHHHGHRHR